MTFGDDDNGFAKARPIKSGDDGVSSTRETREEMKRRFGGQFSSKLAKEYERLTPEQRSDMEGMTESEAKKELRKSLKNREKLEETMRNTEPAWKSEPQKAEAPRKVKGKGVIDVGRGDILIGGRGGNDTIPGNDPETDSGDDIPDGTEWRSFTTCEGETIQVLCKV